ncbi:MAG: phosphoribosyltransferase family protein [Acidobacteriota bacterium]|jgi:hypoxanthine phosphoribosyltransferase|nr:phosphoribosyltransferase family protein [Acidobacteriota bacterium]
MNDKLFVDAGSLLNDSMRLGIQVLKSGFRPSFIVGIWRGGTPVGIAVQELLDFNGIQTDHIAIRTSAYSGIARRNREIRVHGLDYIVDQINAEDGLLIVDDVYDTGLSIQAVKETLQRRCRRNMPQDVRVAVVYFKPENNLTSVQPDFFVHCTDKWLIFPHELDGLTAEEVRRHKPGIAAMLEEIKK